MSSKSFVKTLVTVVVLFFIANVVLYFGFVNTAGPGADPKDAFKGSDKTHGDLSVLASRRWPDSATPQKVYSTQHIEFSDYLRRTEAGEDIKVDVVTIGDSFTNTGGGAYYQDYMAERYGLTVVNVKTLSGVEALDMVKILADSGYLAAMQPRVIIVESVERYLATRYDRASAPSRAAVDAKRLKSSYLTMTQEKKDEQSSLLPGFMVKRNLIYLKSQFNSNSKTCNGGEVSWAALDTDVFTTGTQASELMYFTQDIKNTTGDAVRIEQNIATVAAMCRA